LTAIHAGDAAVIVAPAVSPVQSLDGEERPIEEDCRLFSCARCKQSMRICTYCDRGQIYCDGPCRTIRRRESKLAAALRFQTTRDGRRQHAARQQRYRERCREKVTRQGPPPPPIPATLPLVTEEARQSPAGQVPAEAHRSSVLGALLPWGTVDQFAQQLMNFLPLPQGQG
jgi:hypothetical protein